MSTFAPNRDREHENVKDMKEIDLGRGTNDYYVISTKPVIPKPTEERISNSVNSNAPSSYFGNAYSHPGRQNYYATTEDSGDEGYKNSSFVYSTENIPHDLASKPPSRLTEPGLHTNSFKGTAKTKCCSGKRAVVISVVVIFIILLIAAVVTLGVLLRRASQTYPSLDTRIFRSEKLVSFNGDVSLAWNWDDAMANRTSKEFRNISSLFVTEMDRIYHSSSQLFTSYNHTKVTHLREGSIEVEFSVFFNEEDIVKGDVIHKRVPTLSQVEEAFSTFLDVETLPVIQNKTRFQAAEQGTTTVRPTDAICRSSDMRCSDGSCIFKTLICDGVAHCPQGDDETGCVRHSSSDGAIEVHYQGIWTPICIHNLNLSLTHSICRYLGAKTANNATGIVRSAQSYLEYKDIGNSHWLSHLQPRSSCFNSRVLKLTCKSEDSVCGQRSSKISSSLIIGGAKSVAGDWPWVVSILVQGHHVCGGVIIHPEFIVTAAHCISGKENLVSVFTVVAGTLEWGDLGHHGKKYQVISMKAHEGYDSYSHDIGLLQLLTPIVYTDYIRPICLPDFADVYTSANTCYLAGWGRTSISSREMSPTLNELPLQLKTREKCNGKDSWNGDVRYGLICAENSDSSTNGCNGDSGSPLMCLNEKNNRWSLLGVMSFVSVGCRSANKPPVFVDIFTDLGWIHTHTECVFKCDNKKCLYNKEKLCNRKDDCGDNSDEIRDCKRSVACDFNDAFLCGYTISGWVPSSGSTLPTALSDHTLGSLKGQFLYSFGESRLRSPPFQAKSTYCVRFFYHSITWSGNNGEFSVILHDEKTSKTIWTKTGSDDIDRWKMQTFTIPSGKYEIEFFADQYRVVSIDDISVAEGECNTKSDVCQTGETQCENEPTPQCLLQDAQCNIAWNCIGASDESTCSDVPSRVYSCTFKDTRFCAIRRRHSLQHNGWQVAQVSTISEFLKVDHTTLSATGAVMYTRSYEGSEFKIKFWTHSVAHCFIIYYQLLSKSSELILDIVDPLANATIATYKDSGVRNKDWHKVQMQVPKGSFYVEFIAYVNRFPVDNPGESFFAVDDLEMIPGECPTFECGHAGMVRCGTKEICIHSEQKCDRRIDCPGGFDESNCTCTDSEYKCKSGLCIPKTRVCDGNRDCPSGGDEGTLCDQYRSVTCSFDTPFICGYVISTNGDYKWQRHNGNTPTPKTGPLYDHTFKNESGYYMYVESNNGEQYKYTSLISPAQRTPPISASVTYYFHILGEKSGFGHLQVSWTNGSINGTQSILSLVELVSNSEWQKACHNIQPDTPLSLRWMAIRGTGSKADLAIDDIKVSSGACPIIPCPSGKWQCKNGDCIDQTNRCNNSPECPDGTDENNCP